MKKIFIYSYLYGIPAIALAEAQGSGATIESLLQNVSKTIINPLINFLTNCLISSILVKNSQLYVMVQ